MPFYATSHYYPEQAPTAPGQAPASRPVQPASAGQQPSTVQAGSIQLDLNRLPADIVQQLQALQMQQQAEAQQQRAPQGPAPVFSEYAPAPGYAAYYSRPAQARPAPVAQPQQQPQLEEQAPMVAPQRAAPAPQMAPRHANFQQLEKMGLPNMSLQQVLGASADGFQRNYGYPVSHAQPTALPTQPFALATHAVGEVPEEKVSDYGFEQQERSAIQRKPQTFYVNTVRANGELPYMNEMSAYAFGGLNEYSSTPSNYEAPAVAQDTRQMAAEIPVARSTPRSAPRSVAPPPQAPPPRNIRALAESTYYGVPNDAIYAFSTMQKPMAYEAQPVEPVEREQVEEKEQPAEEQETYQIVHHEPAAAGPASEEKVDPRKSGAFRMPTAVAYSDYHFEDLRA